ncbi:uncharacterized protein LOC107364921 [Tetranychus urticae]|uniref:uncharacterized protein LOC107364921 n=1 Tax=Tetranychus urticae TaxID=32264 RepID=UPI000D647A54|nr:uncharacterized protein LOC107364921 [Tetranychus urticae]
MRNQQQPPVYEKQGGKGDLMLMMMMMMTMMKNMEGKPSHPWGVSSNWPPPPTGNPWPAQPVKDPWPTTTPAPVKDPWPSPVKDPWPSPPSDPWTTTTPAPDPWATKPSNPWDSKPSDPWAAKPSDPWATKPSNPWEAKPSNPWDSAKGTGNPWDQGGDKGGGSFWDKLKAANPWDKLKAANPWDQGNKKGGNPWDQFKQTNPWDPIDDAKRKVAADFGYGDMTNAQYTAMMNQMAEMLKYYMKNVTTTPAPGGKIEDCPKCNVQVNINNSNASPRHNQTQSTSYGVKKRTKEAKIKAAPSDPSEPEAPPEDDAAPVDGEEPPLEPVDPDDPNGRPVQEDPTMDGVLGGGEVDLDGDGLPDPLGQQFTRYGRQKQYLARKRKDQARPRRLRGHTLGSSMILPHEPYNGVRYAVPVKQGQHLSAIQRYQSSGAPLPSLPIAGHPIVLAPHPSPVVPIVQPGYTDRTLAYTQGLSGNYGQQSIPGHLLPSQNNQGPAVVRFVPVRPVESTDSSYGYINQFGQKMGQSQSKIQHGSSTDQIDKSKYEIFRNSESQRDLDYLTESPNYPKGSSQGETMSTNNEMTEDVIIEKPVLGKPPPVHKAPMEYKLFTGGNDRPSQPLTSSPQPPTTPSTPSESINAARVESRMDYQDSNLPMMMDKPIYVQQQSESRQKLNENVKDAFKASNKVIREPTPTPSASQPKAISLMETSSLPPGRHNFRANGLSPSPLSMLSEAPSTETTFSTRSNFRVNDRSKLFRPDSVDPSSSNGVKDSIKLSSLPTSKPFSNYSRNDTLSNSTTTFYSYPLSIESSSSSSTSSFSTFPINSFSESISVENGSQLADKVEKYDSFVDQKNDLRVNQENGTYLWKEISDNLDAINNSNYNSKLSDKTNPTTTIAMDRLENDFKEKASKLSEN